LSKLEITYGTDWCSMFIAGLPPKDLEERQWGALTQLASIYGKRMQDQRVARPLDISFPGGWSITARTAEFGRLHDIAGAILAHQYGPLAVYRDGTDAP
jgi:hypothetical protein